MEKLDNSGDTIFPVYTPQYSDGMYNDTYH